MIPLQQRQLALLPVWALNRNVGRWRVLRRLRGARVRDFAPVCFPYCQLRARHNKGISAAKARRQRFKRLARQPSPTTWRSNRNGSFMAIFAGCCKSAIARFRWIFSNGAPIALILAEWIRFSSRRQAECGLECNRSTCWRTILRTRERLVSKWTGNSTTCIRTNSLWSRINGPISHKAP